MDDNTCGSMIEFKPDGSQVVVPYDGNQLGFEFEGTYVINPFVSECSRFYTNPTYYGFEVYGTGGSLHAYKKELQDGSYLLLTTDEGLLPYGPDDVENAVMGLYSAEGVQLLQVNIDDIPMG